MRELTKQSEAIGTKIVEPGTEKRLHVWYEPKKPGQVMQRSYFVLFPEPSMSAKELRQLAHAELAKLGNPQVYQSLLSTTVKEEFPL